MDDFDPFFLQPNINNGVNLEELTDLYDLGEWEQDYGQWMSTRDPLDQPVGVVAHAVDLGLAKH